MAPTAEKVGSEAEALNWKDFVPDVDVRWCPGCGDYAILNTMQKVCPTLGIPRENFVMVSGIGCSSRFPYYMNTYGMHSIHGRAPTFAMGIKVANPELSVWLITGDGDGLSIGGNHLMHMLRRNLDINVILFNNRIYGLTKGQYSPTSRIGHKTPTSPEGSIDHPIKPLRFALAAEASFVARTVDTDPKHMAQVFKAAAAHKGTSFVEVLQNCVIYHNEAWKHLTDRDVRDDQLIFLQHGEPLRYGKAQNMGIRLDHGIEPTIVKIGEHGVTEKDLVVHDAMNPNPVYAYMLTELNYMTNAPTPIGVFRAVQESLPYNVLLHEQIKKSVQRQGKGRLQDLLLGNAYWEVDDDNHIQMCGPEHQAKTKLDEMVPTGGSEDELQQMDEQKAAELAARHNPLLRVLGEPLTHAIETRGKIEPPSVKATDTVANLIHVINDRKYDGVLVFDEKMYMVGIVTGRDVVMKVVNQSMDRKNTTVDQIMSPNPVWLKESASIGQAFNKFSLGRFRHLPVIRDNGSIALISTTGLLFYIYDRVHQDRRRKNAKT
jgi:2-oxoglutarate ferredoxin oxidoreductase subunit beta